jgi:hypothetical protein
VSKTPALSLCRLPLTQLSNSIVSLLSLANARSHAQVAPGYHSEERLNKFGQNIIMQKLKEQAASTSTASNTRESPFKKRKNEGGEEENGGSKSQTHVLTFQFSSFASFPKNYKEQLVKTFSTGGDSNENELKIVWPTQEECKNSYEGCASGCFMPSAKDKVEPSIGLLLPLTSAEGAHPFVQARRTHMPIVVPLLSMKLYSTVIWMQPKF